LTKNEQLRLMTLALCCGDALGSTSEFVHQHDIPSLYERNKATGWPCVQIGGGPFNWKPGEHTDDGAMALAMVKSFVEKGNFDPSDIARRWVEWMDSHPPDIGNATRSGLASIKRGMHWHEGGLGDLLRNPKSAANGSLMRNAPVAAMANNLGQAFEFSLRQSIITHYGPLSVVCCCAQTFLLWRLLKGENPFEDRWQDDFFESFSQWHEMSQDPIVREWSDKTIKHQVQAWRTFVDADYDPDSFTPFGYAFDGKDGYCLLTLQIAVWATRWSLRDEPYPTPARFPDGVFKKAAGAAFGTVVPLIGHDSDTYAAVAFPMIAAAHGYIPKPMTEGLKVLKLLDELVHL